jgi:hypothetical protein
MSYNGASCFSKVDLLKLTSLDQLFFILQTMEQRAFKNVSNCLNTNIYSYLETFGGKSLNLYLDVVHFFYTCDK